MFSAFLNMARIDMGYAEPTAHFRHATSNRYWWELDIFTKLTLNFFHYFQNLMQDLLNLNN